MNNRGISVLLGGMGFVVPLAGCATEPLSVATHAAVIPAAASRTFTITYTATVPGVPEGGKRIDLWIPVPSSDAQQTIDDVQVDSTVPHQLEVEKEYGGRILHLWNDQAAHAQATLRFRCTRREENALPGDGPLLNISPGPEPAARLLQADRLGIIDDRIRRTAEEITAGKTDTLVKARALYDHVLSHMAYDKHEPGWGKGDTARACEVGKGNCTDFHALFISLARAASIPARFGIGFPLPANARDGKLESYHCWAEFWLPGTGWVPIDASEASKHPDRRDYYFGHLDADRVRLSVGRDLHLAGMKGEPVNYLLGPYAEVDGKPLAVGKPDVTFAVEQEKAQ